VLETPRKVTLVAGTAEGKHELTAFDGALLAAGIGNLNLIQVSSILPPEVELVDDLLIPPGSLTPTAYGCISSSRPGELISAAIGVGFARGQHGMIMEHAGLCTREEAEEVVTDMIHEAFARRGMRLADLAVRAVEHEVHEVGAAVAAAVLWY